MTLSPGRIFPALFVTSLLSLSACSEKQACALLGDWEGAFYGDEEGDLVISLVDSDTPDEAILQVTLQGAGGAVADGTSTISCDGNDQFQLELENVDDGTRLGDFGGKMGTDGTGEGDWSFDSGEAGTWDMSKAQ
jgi:hypothetical protein